jgi:hypothetical protein
MKPLRYALTILLAAGFGCSDTRRATYASLQEASAAGAIARGWVPAFLPGTAVQIEEVHDLDLSRGWVRFHSPWADMISLVDRSKRRSATALSAVELQVPSKPADWPPELQRPLIATPRTSLFIYQRRDSSSLWCLALDSVRAVGFVWHCGLNGPSDR